MRTKTTILSAVALAAGLLSSHAQVYSANVVGYYNIVTPAHAYNLVANQLTNAAGNTVNNVLSSGSISDVNGVLNTTLYRWNGSGYTVYQYFTGPDADNYFLIGPGSPAGWYDAGGNLATTSLDQGTGHFIYNPAATAVTNTIVGQVPQGAFSKSITTGFNTYSVIPPVSTNIDSALVGFPGTSDVNGVNNDTLYKWSGSSYTVLQYFTGSDADNYFLIGPGSPTGFYDAGGTFQSLNTALQPKVGEGFFIRHFVAPTAWNYSFTVQ